MMIQLMYRLFCNLDIYKKAKTKYLKLLKLLCKYDKLYLGIVEI